MTEIKYPAMALANVTLALYNALKRVISEDEGADLHGATVEELLINVLRWHPEPNVSNWAIHEIADLFSDTSSLRVKVPQDTQGKTGRSTEE